MKNNSTSESINSLGSPASTIRIALERLPILPLSCSIFFIAFMILYLVYKSGLNGPLLLDDYVVLDQFLEPSGHHEDGFSQLISHTGPLGRPISMLSFAVSSLLGGTEIYWWKAHNLILHGLTGLLLFLFGLEIAQKTLQKRQEAYLFAFLLSMLWLFHPLHVSTVLYVVQRMAMLSALFCVLGMLLYCRGRRHQIQGDPRGILDILLALLVATACAAFSKENGLILPFLLVVIEVCIFRLDGGSRARRQVVSLFLLCVLVPVFAGVIHLTAHWQGYTVNAYELRDFTFLERLLTEARIMFRYLAQLLVPVRTIMGFFHDDIAVSIGLLKPVSTLLSLMALTGLFAYALYLLTRVPLVALGILIFLFGHVIESTIIPLELMFEHRNYLPAIGIFIVLAFVPFHFDGRTRSFMCICTLTLVCVFTVSTYTRASIWGNKTFMAVEFYRLHPRSERATSMLAEVLLNQKKHDAAIALLSPSDNPGHNVQKLYIQCLRDGRLPSGALASVRFYSGAVLPKTAIVGLIELSNLFLDKKCDVDRMELGALVDAALRNKIRGRGDRRKLLFYRGHLYASGKEWDMAVGELEKAAKLRPDDPVPYLLSAEWLLEGGSSERARESFSRGLLLAETGGKTYQEMIAGLREMFMQREE